MQDLVGGAVPQPARHQAKGAGRAEVGGGIGKALDLSEIEMGAHLGVVAERLGKSLALRKCAIRHAL